MMKLFRPLWESARYRFLDTFGERDYERSIPAHGDWTEEPGWWWRGKFYYVNQDKRG